MICNTVHVHPLSVTRLHVLVQPTNLLGIKFGGVHNKLNLFGKKVSQPHLKFCVIVLIIMLDA